MFYYIILYVVVLYILRYVIFYTIDALGCLSVPKATFRSGFGWFCLLRIEVPESNVRHWQPQPAEPLRPSAGWDSITTVLLDKDRMGLNPICVAWQEQPGTQSDVCCLTRTWWGSIGCVLLDNNIMGLNRVCVAWQELDGGTWMATVLVTGWRCRTGPHSLCSNPRAWVRVGASSAQSFTESRTQSWGTIFASTHTRLPACHDCRAMIAGLCQWNRLKLIREIQKRFWCILFPHVAYWLLAPLFCLHCLCWSMNELEVSPNEVEVAPTGMIREQMEDDILGSNGASAWLSTKTSATGRVGQPSSSKRKRKGCWTRSWFEHGGPSLSPRRKASCLASSHFEHRSSH